MNQSSFDKATQEPNRLWLLIAGCLGLLVCVCAIAIAGVLFVPAEQFTTLRQLLGLSSADVGAIVSVSAIGEIGGPRLAALIGKNWIVVAVHR